MINENYLKNIGANDVNINSIEEIIMSTFHNPSFLIFFPNIFIV